MIALLVAALLSAPQAGALAPAVRDAESRTAPVWISYRVPIVPGPRRLCFDTISGHAADPSDLHLAVPPASELIVFARFERGRVDRIRSFTPDCPVDAGTTPIVRLETVDPADSVAWLVSVISGRPDHAAAGVSAAAAPPGNEVSSRVVDAALLALSLHADASALPRLIDLARDDPRPRVRGQALFWLAERAGDRALATIGSAADADPATEVRKKAVFALSQLPKDEGVPKLIELARTNAHPDVRKQAMFWLGQSNDPRAVAFFQELLLK